LHSTPCGVGLGDESLAGAIGHGATASGKNSSSMRGTPSTHGNLSGVLRRYTRFEHFLSGSVVHRDECGVCVELPMEKITAVPFGHNAVDTHNFWIQCCAHGR